MQEVEDGTTTVEYIRGSDYGGGIGGVLYTVRGGNRSYNAYNSRGDVVSQTGDNEAITWQAAYEAFGTRTEEEGGNIERQRGNTKDEDPWGGLNEHHRYRDLEFGVFYTRDPAGFVDGPNVYTYVRQNPWTAFDPTGLFMHDAGNWLANNVGAPPSFVRSMAKHTGTVVGGTQLALTGISAVPALGKVADGASALISSAEGKYGEAALTLAAGKAISVAGKGLKAGVVGAKTLKASVGKAGKVTNATKVVGGAAEGASSLGGKSAKEVATNASEGGDHLVRFGKGPETKESLAEQAAAAKANSDYGVHGVSTKRVKRVSGSDKKHRSAQTSDVEAEFPVQQTGPGPNHHTVELPDPVTDEATDTFNKLFSPKE